MEIAQIGGYIQRKTVRSYPTADVNPNGRDLTVAHPYASELGNARGFDSVIGECLDDRLLDAAHIGADIAFPVAQIDDGITYQLTRAVISHITAAVGRIERNAGAG